MMRLTDEQEIFLGSEGRIVLSACPGSGKTYIVAKKVLNYLQTWQCPYRGIAALSFTNVAKNEILKTISEGLRQKGLDFRFPHYIGTLDSFINNYIFLRFGYLMNKANPIRPRTLLEVERTIRSRNPSML